MVDSVNSSIIRATKRLELLDCGNATPPSWGFGLAVGRGSSFQGDTGLTLHIRGTNPESRLQGYGIDITGSSYLRFNGGGFLIENYEGDGMWVGRNSTASIRNFSDLLIANIRNNSGDGICAAQQSSINIEEGMTISNNSQNGISASDNSDCRIIGATLENNNGGIVARRGAYIDVSNSTIQNNGDEESDPAGIFADNAIINVRDSTISGNDGGDIDLFFRSTATMNNLLGVPTITCDGTVVSRGTNICP